MTKNKSGFLSEEDKKLWDRVSKTVQKKAQKQHRHTPDQDHAHGKKLFQNLLQGAQIIAPVKANKPSLVSDKAVPKSQNVAPARDHTEGPKQFVPPNVRFKNKLDRRVLAKLSKGHIPIEGQLDLHGLTQAQAFGAVRHYLRQAYQQHKIWVLIITGKGKSSRPYMSENSENQGVLRQMLPHWLGHGDLAPIVAGLSSAHHRHGGEGAFYVRLKRNHNKGTIL